MRPRMASSNPEDVVSGPPPKRQKMSPSSTINTTQPDKDVKMDDRKTQLVVSDNGFQFEREAQAGILHFVNLSNPGFSGTLKQRYVFGRVSIPPSLPSILGILQASMHVSSFRSLLFQLWKLRVFR